MGIVIRPEQESDIAAVYAVNEAAFGTNAEARLVDLLRPTAAFIPELSLVAEVDGTVVGHVLFTEISIVDGGHSHRSLALAPVAVLPTLQGKGIGSLLIEEGLSVSAQLGFASVIVLGHESYYPRFGFLPAERWGIKAPFDVPSNVFMALELKPEGLVGVSGTVVYPKEFESV